MIAYDKWKADKTDEGFFGKFRESSKYWVRPTASRQNTIYPTKPIVAKIMDYDQMNGGISTPDSAASVLYQAGFVLVDKNNKPHYLHDDLKKLINEADRIRVCVLNYYVTPARDRGESFVTIDVSSLPLEIGTRRNIEEITRYLSSDAFLKLAHVGREKAASARAHRASDSQLVFVILPTATAERRTQHSTNTENDSIRTLTEELADIKSIEDRSDIGETEKEHLIKARIGQGKFRSELQKYEKRCRLTEASNPDYLRASHMKPWCKSTDIERLDGNNGLLLSPHVDHLFDKGYLTFSDDGKIIVSKEADPDVLARWHISAGKSCGSFSKRQLPYLKYHRKHCFKRGPR